MDNYWNKFVLCGVLIAISVAFAQLDTQWVELYGSEYLDRIYDHIEIEDGGFVFTGHSFYNGDEGVWLGKTNRDGELLWDNVYFGEEIGSSGYSLFEDDDGGYLIFGYMVTMDEDRNQLNNILVTKINAEGDSVLWTKTYGGDARDQAYKAVRTDDGGFAVAGVTTSWGEGREDFFLLKLDENCDSLWMRTYGSEGIDICYDLIQRSDGSYALIGSTTIVRNAPNSYWLVVVTEEGEEIWEYTESYNRVSSSYGKTIQELANGDLIVSGYVWHDFGFPNTSRIWTICFNSDARKLWDRLEGPNGPWNSGWRGLASCLLSDSSIAVSGMYSLSPEFGSPRGKLWIIEVTTSGESRLVLDEGWEEAVYVHSMSWTSDNELFLAGEVTRLDQGSRPDGIIFKTSELPNGIKTELSGSIPHNLLISAYPNPFNSGSSIAFSLQQPGTVSIDIFNALGRQQADLLSGYYPAGLHSTSWDGGDLPSGDYIVRMTAGGLVTSRKVTMIK